MSNPNAEKEDFTDSIIDQTVRRCKFCKKIGHVRRSYTDCDQHISGVRPVDVVVSPEVETETTGSIPEVVTEATGIISEPTTQTAEIIVSIPEVVPQLILNVTCRFCGLEGHE
ncbi:hypothetical protein BD770DRAFT_417060 [Pilaira anomala]|nr:hypothetical protein BD770DRAFT_417060 [Pilaira anomala]